MRSLAALVALIAVPGIAFGEPIPLPRTDFSATYTVTAPGSPANRMTMRHSGGKVRMAIAIPGGLSADGYLDLATKKAIMVMAIPGAGPMAMEMDMGMLPKAWSAPEGRRAGSQRIGGETCDVWEHAEPTQGIATVSCITPDGVLLRSESRKGSAVVALVEAVEVSRARQDPATLVAPKNLPVMQIPAGMIPGLKP